MNNLKVLDLQYKYKNVQALKGISFEVNDGLIGVLGPNGAGKTTAMKLITTLYSIQSGEIYLNDLNYKKDLKSVRQAIGYLPQDFATYGTLTGREFLEIVASLKLDFDRKNISKHIDEIITKLNMQEYINRRIKEYSGGMNQKLGFAQVLVGDPKLIVVDEPTVGLDPEQRNTIRELFPVISKNRIVLATTHIVEDIEYYCNYLLVIKEGKLIYSGTKENFINEAEKVVWEADVDNTTFGEMASDNKVITTIQLGDKYHVKYINEKPLTGDSEQAKINLQDAYIVHSKLSEKGINL